MNLANYFPKRILQRIRRYSKMRFWSMSLVCMTILIIVITSDMGIIGFKLCGWRLAETLQMVCKDYGGFYSSHLRHTRDVSSGDFTKIQTSLDIQT
ncbi:UNVERIFIED_CONTAM: hypothetical protein NCL1_09699 [Trichonephila clavipes]